MECCFTSTDRITSTHEKAVTTSGTVPTHLQQAGVKTAQTRGVGQLQTSSDDSPELRYSTNGEGSGQFHSILSHYDMCRLYLQFCSYADANNNQALELPDPRHLIATRHVNHPVWLLGLIGVVSLSGLQRGVGTSTS